MTSKYKKIPLEDQQAKKCKGFRKNPGVYVIRYGDFYRIGRSEDLRTRTTSHLSNLPPGDKEVLYMLPAQDEILFERDLHEFFGNSRHGRTEWFSLSEKDLRNLYCIMVQNGEGVEQ